MQNETTKTSEKKCYDPNKEGEKRMGFMIGEMTVLDDINRYDDEVMRLFGFSEGEIAEDMQRRKQNI